MSNPEFKILSDYYPGTLEKKVSAAMVDGFSVQGSLVALNGFFAVGMIREEALEVTDGDDKTEPAALSAAAQVNAQAKAGAQQHKHASDVRFPLRQRQRAHPGRVGNELSGAGSRIGDTCVRYVLVVSQVLPVLPVLPVFLHELVDVDFDDRPLACEDQAASACGNDVSIRQ